MSRRFITGMLSAAILVTAISVAAPARAAVLPALERFFGAATGLFVLGHILGVADGAAAGGGDVAAAPATSWRETVNPHRRAGPYWAPEQSTWGGSRG